MEEAYLSLRPALVSARNSTRGPFTSGPSPGVDVYGRPLRAPSPCPPSSSGVRPVRLKQVRHSKHVGFKPSASSSANRLRAEPSGSRGYRAGPRTAQGWTPIPGKGPLGKGPGVGSGRPSEPAGGTRRTGTSCGRGCRAGPRTAQGARSCTAQRAYRSTRV